MGATLITRGGLAVATLAAAAACSSARPEVRPPAPAPGAPTPAVVAELVAGYDTFRVAGLERRQFEPERYWELLLPIVGRAPDRFTVREVGRSIESRPIRRIDFGHGETTVLLWSQMHGNESTASRALVDIFNFLVSRADDPLTRQIEAGLRVTVVPVLNPDGAARFVRHNAIGVDINRDARRLATPEGRALKAVRDDVQAQWGFNLHDQNVRTRLGRSGNDVLIALLAPPPGPGQTSPQNLAARQMCSFLAQALGSVVGEQVARYDESFNPRAFGDLMTSWGTGVVLIESGGELADPDKARLRRANFVAILTALAALADDGWQAHSSERYLNLPLNSAWIYDLVVRGAAIVLPGSAPVRADFAVNFDDTLDQTGGAIVEVGDLQEVAALEEIDASGLYYIPAATSADAQAGHFLRVGDTATGVLARDPQGDDVVMRLVEGRRDPQD